MIMRNEVLIAQNMENLCAKSVCLLEAFLAYVDFCHVLFFSAITLITTPVYLVQHGVEVN
jgi:hypothetical protein